MRNLESNPNPLKISLSFGLVLFLSFSMITLFLSGPHSVQAQEPPTPTPEKRVDHPVTTSPLSDVIGFHRDERFYVDENAKLQASTPPTVTINPIANWFSNDSDASIAVAWGDMDGDGDLDLAVGNDGSANGLPNKVYLNENGILQDNPIWQSRDEDYTHSIAWGDMDGDGDLDLAVGNYSGFNKIYLNEDGMLSAHPAWSFPASLTTESIVWGDMDGDGDLDLITGNQAALNIIWLNEGPTGFKQGGPACNDVSDWERGTPVTGPGAAYSGSYAWATVLSGTYSTNFDDALASPNIDLSSQNGPVNIGWQQWLDTETGYDYAYVDVSSNGGNTWTTVYSATGAPDNYVWAKHNLNLDSAYATGNFRLRFRILSDYIVGDPGFHIDDVSVTVNNVTLYTSTFESDGGGFTPYNNMRCFGSAADATLSLSVADLDGDSDLDVAEGNYQFPNVVYRNEGGGFHFSPVWTDSLYSATTFIAWGDMNGDNSPDLATGNLFEPNLIYENLGNTLAPTPVWSDTVSDGTNELAWGDVDGDNDLDLAVANTANGIGAPNKIYLNNGAMLESAPSWESDDADVSVALALGDADGDGDLDLAIANRWTANKVHENEGGSLQEAISFTPVVTDYSWTAAWGDVDGDNDLDLAVGNWFGPNKIYQNNNGVLQSAPMWTDGVFSNTFSLAWGDVNGDGLLDLAVGNNGEPNRVYLNLGATLDTSPVWTDNLTDTTWSLAWGDIDNDGDLDLAVGNELEANRIYLNNNGTLQPVASYNFAEGDGTLQLAWADVDGDGDLDLGTVNWERPNRLYLNEGGVLHAAWASDESDFNQSLAWGDADGDGDLDMAVSIGGYPSGGPNKIYYNRDGMLETSASWHSQDTETTLNIAWADVDGDGDLDLTAGNREAPNKVYFNRNGVIQTVAGWQSDLSDHTRAFVWGDIDGDGDLDAVHANLGEENYITYNGKPSAAPYTPRPASIAIGLYSDSTPTFSATSTALAPANFYATPAIRDSGLIPVSYTLRHLQGQPIKEIRGYYSLDGGDNWLPAVPSADTPVQNISPLSAPIPGAYCSAPGLVIPDGDLGGVSHDIVIPDSATLTDLNVYLKINHVYVGDLDVSLEHLDTATSLTLLDRPGLPSIDPTYGCGYPNIDTTLDDQALLAAETNCPATDPTLGGALSPNSPLTVFNGEDMAGTWRLKATDNITPGGGILAQWCLLPTVIEPSATANIVSSGVFTWDVFQSGFFGQSDNVVFRLEAYPDLGPQAKATAGPYQWPYVSAQTYPFRVRGNQVRVYSQTIGLGNEAEGALVYRLPQGQVAGGQAFSRNTGQPFRTDSQGFLRGRGYINPGDRLLALYPATETTCSVHYSDDVPKIIPNDDAIAIHSFLNVGQSGIVEDVNVVVISGTHTWLSDLDFNLTSPAGTEINLMGASCGSNNNFNLGFDDQAPPGAFPCPPTDGNLYQPNQPLSTFNGEDSAGLWELTINDSFFLDGGELQQWGLEICATEGNLFYTNGTPIVSGLNDYTVNNLGVQNLVVSTQNPLMLFNVNVALEWDSHTDSTYLDQLAFDLKRASAYLYDFSDGQVALGDVIVSQNADNWASSHVIVRASNAIRPFAVQGGVVLTATVDPQHSEIVYDVGQVTMGATWNRYGNPGQSLGQDWPLILAHELSHYLLFLDDTYLGLDDDGLLISVDTCTGSAMGDVYVPGNTEFVFDPLHWADEINGCGRTLSQKTLNRTEWQTIDLWYPPLIAPTSLNEGPTIMPYEFTAVSILDPVTPTNALEDPTFYLDYQNNAASTSEARAFLMHNGDGNPADFEYMVDLGNPTGGQNRVKARGAGPGDRLCVFDPSHNQYACEIISEGDDRLAMAWDATWTPLIRLSPVTSRTFNLAVESLPSGLTLQAKLYPEYGYASDVITLTETSAVYSGTFSLPLPALAGQVQVWVDEAANPRREAIVSYSIGGNPGFTRGGGGFTRGGGGFTRGGGGFTRGGGGFTRGGGGFTRGGGAPLLSPDGQMTFFTENPIVFEEGDFYTIQNMSSLPPLPAGQKPIGQGYSLVATQGAPVITNAAVSYQYLGNDVLLAEVDEADLTIHFWNGSAWVALDTTVNEYFNLASAPSQGAGIYALLGGVTAPQISAINPRIATNDVVTTLTISGLNFLAPVNIRLQGSDVYTFTAHTVGPNAVQVDIPAGLAAQEFEVVVINGGGQTVTAPETFALFEPYNACFYDFFESGANKWTRTGNWDVVTLPNNGGTAITDSPEGNYDSAPPNSGLMTTQITSIPFDLSACSNPLLTIKHDYRLAKVGSSIDRAKVEVSSDGGANWTELKAYTGGGIYGTYVLKTPSTVSSEWLTPTWKTAELGLSAYTGTVQLRLSLEVDETAADKGWLIDEVLVTSAQNRSADLGLTISHNSGIAFAGQSTAFELNAQNIGPDTVDAVAKGLFSSGVATVTAGTETCGGDKAIACGYDDLSANDTATVWVRLSPNFSGTLTVSAVISGAYPYFTEINPLNNQSQVVIEVKQPAARIYLPLVMK